jgi:hypothetical protein
MSDHKEVILAQILKPELVKLEPIEFAANGTPVMFGLHLTSHDGGLTVYYRMPAWMLVTIMEKGQKWVDLGAP